MLLSQFAILCDRIIPASTTLRGNVSVVFVPFLFLFDDALL